MFLNLGLLKSGKCPDGESCTRIRCFFNHGPSDTSSTPSKKVEKKRPLDASLTSPAKALKISDMAKDSVNASSGRVSAKAGKPTPKTASPVIPPAPARAVVKPQFQVAPTPPKVIPASIAGPSTLVPILSKSSKTSPHPWTERQKGLRTLHTQFEKLYSSIPNVKPKLARQNAIDQELEISTTSNSTQAYKRSIHHAAVQVSRRAKPNSIDHPSVGSLRESRIATEKAEKEALSKLTRERIERYLLPVDEFEKWRYPNPNDDTLVNPPVITPDGEGSEQKCSRCKKEFVVSSKRLKERFGECHFHHGRLAPERIEGIRKWIYSCCRRERGEEGCEEGVHVYNHGDDDAMLAERVSYVRVGKGVDSSNLDGAEVLGMDCEMIYTTAGSSLARVTIVDENGTAVLDEVVRQHVPVLDVNARFSGISQEQLDAAVMDIQGVRAASLMFIGPETILVGHGLENDLRALRILHDRIIDTAVIFPHDKGHPFRRALRDIVKEKLGIFIQDRTADLGHSSAEDAKAALDLLKWRVRDDKDD